MDKETPAVDIDRSVIILNETRKYITRVSPESQALYKKNNIG